jgi:hypothetical protein
MATLRPGLIIDDLGPILSITRSIGGCTLAYIGPGLAYLGVKNGYTVLAFLAAFMDSKNHKANATSGDLPMEGDARFLLFQSFLWSFELLPELLVSYHTSTCRSMISFTHQPKSTY